MKNYSLKSKVTSRRIFTLLQTETQIRGSDSTYEHGLVGQWKYFDNTSLKSGLKVVVLSRRTSWPKFRGNTQSSNSTISYHSISWKIKHNNTKLISFEILVSCISPYNSSNSFWMWTKESHKRLYVEKKCRTRKSTKHETKKQDTKLRMYFFIYFFNICILEGVVMQYKFNV